MGAETTAHIEKVCAGNTSQMEAVARLQHPNIVQLHEVGEVRGQPFFSLEFCDGGTLSEQLKKKRLSPLESADLIETLARAMHYAHLRGVVHRDLKPGNVLLSRGEGRGARGEGRSSLAPRPSSLAPIVKITDFGLAKRIDDEVARLAQLFAELQDRKIGPCLFATGWT